MFGDQLETRRKLARQFRKVFSDMSFLSITIKVVYRRLINS